MQQLELKLALQELLVRLIQEQLLLGQQRLELLCFQQLVVLQVLLDHLGQVYQATRI